MAAETRTRRVVTTIAGAQRLRTRATRPERTGPMNRGWYSTPAYRAGQMVKVTKPGHPREGQVGKVIGVNRVFNLEFQDGGRDSFTVDELIPA